VEYLIGGALDASRHCLVFCIREDGRYRGSSFSIDRLAILQEGHSGIEQSLGGNAELSIGFLLQDSGLPRSMLIPLGTQLGPLHFALD
jgi:hypothetical protein